PSRPPVTPDGPPDCCAVKDCSPTRMLLRDGSSSTTMRRAPSVHLPMWSVDLIRRRWRALRPERGGAVLVAAEDYGRLIVVGHRERAARAGVRAGMTVSHARALWRGDPPIVARHDPAGEARALDALARWAMRFSPVVQPDPPDGLRLDVTGCERLYHGQPRLARLMLDALDRLGLTARLAIAPTLGAAWALARFGGRRCVVARGDDWRDALDPLPVAALRLDPAAVADLADMGVHQVRHLLALPRPQLAARFGHDLLLRIDQ